jgi:dihydroorotase-like cyclic amidohydrolase
MARMLFKNCRVWDGSGAPAFPADVLIEGERIRAVATQRGQLEAAGAETIETNGMTLMQGLRRLPAHWAIHRDHPPSALDWLAR